jgi:hypothetical protein
MTLICEIPSTTISNSLPEGVFVSAWRRAIFSIRFDFPGPTTNSPRFGFVRPNWRQSKPKPRSSHRPSRPAFPALCSSSAAASSCCFPSVESRAGALGRFSRAERDADFFYFRSTLSCGAAHDTAFFVVSAAVLRSRFQIQISRSDSDSVFYISPSGLRSCCSAAQSFSLPLRFWSRTSDPFCCRQFLSSLDPFSVPLAKLGLRFLLRVFDFCTLVLIQPLGRLLFFHVACCCRRGVQCSSARGPVTVGLLIFGRS